MNSRSAGFTLAEILVVTLVGALVMGSIYQMIVMQERSTREQYAIIETQQNARTALAVLTNDLREISAADGDITAAAQTDISFRAMKKAGVVCNKIDNNNIDVWALGGPYAAGDSVLIFEDGTNNASASDDTWEPVAISSVTTTTCPAGANPFTVPATSIQRLTFTTSPLAQVAVGALVRSFLPTRYRITDNGEWGQLMRTDTMAETAIIEHLARTADDGLRFVYFDAAGAQIPNGSLATNLTNIMRIQVKVRGKAVSQASTTGANRFQDSLVTTVYLRGNYRTQ